MNELSTRISQLRAVADELQTASVRLQHHVNAVLDLADVSLRDLPALNPASAQYLTIRASIGAWGDRLTPFRRQLNTVADEIELASGGQLTPALPLVIAPVTAVATTSIIGGGGLQAGWVNGWYVSRANAGLYAQWQGTQTQLTEAQTRLTDLQAQRDGLVIEREALHNRLLSYDPHTAIESHPQMVAINGQMAQVEADITQLQADLPALQAQSEALGARLAQVQPLPSVDHRLLASLEKLTDNPAYIHANTYDCVNHVVGRVVIPERLAVDAYRWDDMVRQHPEWGIRISDQPVAGAVMVLEPSHPYADDVFGHVLYVERVDNGVAMVTDNLNPTQAVPVTRLFEQTTGDTVHYLILPWHSKG